MMNSNYQHQLEQEHLFLPNKLVSLTQNNNNKNSYLKATITTEHILTTYYIDLQDTFLNDSLKY